MGFPLDKCFAPLMEEAKMEICSQVSVDETNKALLSMTFENSKTRWSSCNIFSKSIKNY